MEIEYDGEYLTMRGRGSHRQIRLDPDQMIDIMAAFQKWRRRQDAAKNRWIAGWARLGQTHKNQFFSLEEALQYLWKGEHEYQLSALYIECPDGAVLRDNNLRVHLSTYGASL